MRIFNKKQDTADNSEGDTSIPEEISKFYPSAMEAKKIKKPLVCYLIDIDEASNKTPTLVTKPIKVKFGAKWFDIGREQRYFINYSQVMNFGKHYAYLCKYGNSVGALSFYEYPEFADANQVLMMTHQHAVEVFKKHKGISPKLVMIIAIVAAVAVIGMVIVLNIALGFNTQIGNLKTVNAKQAEEIHGYRIQLGLEEPPSTSVITANKK